MPLVLIAPWLGLSLLLIAYAAAADRQERWRWPMVAAIVGVLSLTVVLVWGAAVEPLPRWRGGLVFDELAHLLLPPLWTGAAGAIVVTLFLSSGRYEPAIAALSTVTATAGVLSANPLLTIALLEIGALIILAGLLVHDEGMAGHPLLNIATSLKYLTLTVVSAACLVMALLLANFYALNQDRVELPRIIAALFVIGFGLAVGAMPFYFHVPDVFDAAPTMATASLAGPVQCLAFVYLIRTIANGPWLVTDQHVSDVMVGAAAAGALLSSVMAFGQRRVSRLLAFNALREVSWIAFGLATVSRAGWAGALVFLAVRCVSQPLLLVASKQAKLRHGAIDLDKLGGLARLLPLTTFGWCAAVLASVGLPPAASFWGLAALIGASWTSGMLAAAVLATSAVFAVWRLGQATYAIFWRPATTAPDTSPEPAGPAWTMACLGFGLSFAGVVPRLLQAPIEQLLASLPVLH